MWDDLVRYPDPAVQVSIPASRKYRVGQWPRSSASPPGCRWAEGPVWFGDGRYLLWSDIPNNRIMRWDEETGAVSVFRKPVEQRQRQHARPPGPAASPASTTRAGSRAPSTTARSPSSPTASTASRSTRRTTSSCKSDGSIWFTDPPFGILGYYEGHMAPAGAAARTSTASMAADGQR